MSSQPLPVIPSLGDTFGALFVGATIGAILFGIMNLQALIYYKRYPNDWSLYRYSVALFWILDTVHVGLGTHALYHYLIDMYGNLRGALEENVIWSMRLQLLVKVWTIVFVQGIYAIRLWKLGRHFHKIVPWSVFIAVAASFGNTIHLLSTISPAYTALLLSGSAIHLSYEIYVMRNLVSISMVNASIYTFYSIIITADLIIALMMCYYLHKSRKGMHFSSMADLLLGLMRLVLVSGLATSACSLLSILTFIASPKTLIFVAIDLILPKLYINSLLAMFNYRRQRSSSKSNAEHIGRSIPAVLQFSPNDYEEHNKETDISIPLSDIQDICSLDKSGNSKGTVDSPA
ncbi:hypothetical protein ARMGADRAFT_1169771 [Armillaria gallica]|uniref:DUF6534 domain-containing protein n=1 Tax=Armillaria gallica TaxID=47427 RepID=A0A2H3CPM1_ARMGA|nr:hypothetical protein ARMGADRAFT_1169771 [Armillaria gallica]